MFGSFSEEAKAAETFKEKLLTWILLPKERLQKQEQTPQCCRHPSIESAGCPGKGRDLPGKGRDLLRLPERTLQYWACLEQGHREFRDILYLVHHSKAQNVAECWEMGTLI